MAGIKEIEIEGFKAFPNKLILALNKNLLIYGENGSGKSSIYYALHALLQSVYKPDKGAKYFGYEDSEENLINIYKLDDVKNNGFKPYIKITLDNEHQWELSRDGLSSTPDTADDSELRLLNKTSAFINYSYISRFRSARNSETINLWNVFIKPQFRNIIPCEVLFYIEVTFWALSIDLGIFRSSWFLHRHKIPHPNQWGSMITTKKYSLFYEDFSVVGFICI